MSQVLFVLLQARLESLMPTRVVLLDNSEAHRGHVTNTAGGAHVELQVASPKFKGLTTLACHRLVYGCVADLIPYPVHALSLKILREEA